MLRRLGMVVALLSGLFVVSSCGKDSTAPATAGLRLDQIENALDAVEQKVGVGLEFFEINATSAIVNILLQSLARTIEHHRVVPKVKCFFH